MTILLFHPLVDLLLTLPITIYLFFFLVFLFSLTAREDLIFIITYVTRVVVAAFLIFFLLVILAVTFGIFFLRPIIFRDIFNA
jgi:hypothetical protein